MNPISKFFEVCKSKPQEIAIASTEIQITFHDLELSVRLFAAAFSHAGVKAGDFVAISAKTEVECVATLALLQLAAVSMSGSEPVLRSYQNQIDFLITDNGDNMFPTNKKIVIDQEFMAGLGRFKPVSDVSETNEQDFVRMVFSSGTTGTPKGVPFTAKNLVTRTNSANSNWMPELPFMSLLGLDTVTGMQTFYWAMFSGNKFFVSTNGPNNLTLIRKFDVRCIKSSPARLKDLLSAAEVEPTPTCLKVVEIAGSLLEVKTVENCERILGINPTYLYGSTEVGTVTKGAFSKSKPNKVGRPVEDVEFGIADESGVSVANGVIGRIRYRKAEMPEDYWLTPSSGKTGFLDGWFYPGDIGVVNDQGELELQGRSDDVVNLGGSKFNLLELDTWLQGLALFDEVATFQFQDASGATEIGIAFVSENPPIPELLLKRVRAFIPDLNFKHMLRVKKLPRNRLDKVDRKALAELISR